jgi:endonuclease/exonuclease/phosphatase family metal-dependent hydrolase
MPARARTLAVLGCLVSLVLPAAAVAHGDRDRDRDKEHSRAVKVMTRNIYLGGDIVRPIAAAQGCTNPIACITAAANSAFVLRGIVDQTNFPARARLLAEEIDENEPDLIGLQEVALWRSGPRTQPLVPDAQTVDYDYLEILLKALRREGLRYRAVVVQNEADIEAPSFEGAFTPAGGQDVRLTMRDVILAREGVAVSQSGSGNYQTKFTAPLGVVAQIPVLRGYTWADVTVGRTPLRFINTHLESFFSGIAYGQAAELLQGPAAVTDRTVVMLGDFNSDPLDGSVKPGDPTPHFLPYRLIRDAGHFSDAWLALGTSNPGFTSGLSELVNDPDTSTIDHRIDIVWTRGANGAPVDVQKGRIVGLEERTRGGLWASDHAGVVIKLRP